MDPTGFAVGVVGLAGLVSTCIEAFKILRSIRAYSRDIEILFTKLDIEKELFMHWAQQVGLLKRHTIDGKLFGRRTDELIFRILREIAGLLHEATGMEAKYGESLPVPKQKIGHHYDGKGRREHNEDRALQQRKISIGRKFLWTVHGRDELKNLIDELGYFIGKLTQMIPSIEQRKANYQELKDAGGDVATLSTLMLAEGRSEYGYDSSDGGWEDLAGQVAGQASERRSHHQRHHKQRTKHERPGDESQDDRKHQRRRKEDDDEARRRRKPSPSLSDRSHESSGSSGSSYKSSRSTLVDMFDDVRGGGNRRPISTFR